MKSFSFILSTTVSQELNNLDLVRKRVLVEQMSSGKETEIRFDNLTRIIASSLMLSGKSAGVNEISATILNKKNTTLSADIIAIKNAFDYLRHFCLLKEGPIDVSTITAIIKTLKPQKKIDFENLKTVVEFVNVNPENSVVQAGIFFGLLYDVLPEDNNSIKIASIVSEAFTYKHGYDFRGMINLQEFFFSDLLNLKKKLKTAQDSGNLSQVIEYYVQAYSIQAEKAYQILSKRLLQNKLPDAISKLSERQTKILALFDTPNAKITNKSVQKEFGVSQITASRDLSKLALVGLVFQMGRGRSVYYVKP